MSNITKPIMLDETGQKIADAINLLAVAQGGAPEFTNWRQIRTAVASGMGPRYLPVGTQFVVPHSVYGNLIFDVVAHNHHKNPNDENAPTMTLQMRNVIYSRPFDESEAAYCVTAENHPDGLPAGTYHLLPPSDYQTNEEFEGWTAIKFTTTKALPVGGQIWLNWKYGVKISAARISTYESAAATTALESAIVPSDGTEGSTSLGTIHKYGEDADGCMNVIQRLRYGNGNWNESNIRQWLNAEAESGWWTPAHSLDRLSSTYTSLSGFLHGLDADFAAIIGAVDVTTRKNTVFENDNERGNIVYTTRDKVFLLSRDEVGLGAEGIAQGSVMDFYNGAANADRIKYDYTNAATARVWWLRSPYPGYAYTAHLVGTSGALDVYYAYYGFGAAAACVIY